jgi:hypothetical protein
MSAWLSYIWSLNVGGSPVGRHGQENDPGKASLLKRDVVFGELNRD